MLEERRRIGSREDGQRVALVVEGGAMRGVYTAGTLLALHSIGYAALFDNVYGTSAGAVNAAHFLSGVGHQKVDTYYRFLADGRFFSPRRWSKIIDIDFFVDQVLTTLRPVEVEQVLASPSRLWAAVADYDTAEPLVIDATSGKFPLLQVLKAAVAMPIVYNKTVQLGALRAFDAGFCEPFPLDFALAHGHSHVLVLTARSIDDRPSSRGMLERTMFGIFFAKGNKTLRKALAGASLRSNRLRDLAHGRLPPPNGAAIATLSPVAPLVSSRSQDTTLLRSEMLRTARDTLRLFAADEGKLDRWSLDGTL